LLSELDWHDLEKLGLPKFDLLGLTSLTTMDVTLRLVNTARIERQEPPLRLQDIPLEDADVCRMLSDGDTAGVFQLESDGIRDLLMRLQPDCFEHVIAATALFRPGPLERGLVDEYVARRHGLRRADHLHEVLDVLPQVEATYGLIIYQEQIDEIITEVTGWSLGRADVLRRAMHKHTEGELEDEKQSFIGAAQEREMDAATAAELFDLLSNAAPLAFPRAHAVGYGLVTWWMAYLRCHQTEAFADIGRLPVSPG
jgi:DNA polymerase-3 subunit alpha